jgi:hypothetical protein
MYACMQAVAAAAGAGREQLWAAGRISMWFVCVRGDESERHYSAVRFVNAGALGCGARAPNLHSF